MTDQHDKSDEMEVARQIADCIPYYKFKGIERFYDIGGMIRNPDIFQLAVSAFVEHLQTLDFDIIGAFDARGFILAPPISLALKKPMFMLRKKGKMPNVLTGKPYGKEYLGDDENQKDVLTLPKLAIKEGDRVVLVDDLLATGGTLMAGCELVKQAGGTILECSCLIELEALKARERLKESHADVKIWSLIREDLLTVNGEES